MSPIEHIQRRRPHRLTLRLSAEELGHIRQQAAIANMKPARLLRELAMGACLKAVPRFPADVHRTIKGFGRNLNQLTHQANMGRVDLQEAAAIRSGVESLMKILLG